VYPEKSFKCYYNCTLRLGAFPVKHGPYSIWLERIFSNGVAELDKIKLQRMQFYAYHGVFAEEQKLGQRFVVSMILHLDLSLPGTSDDVADTVNYGLIYDLVKQIVEGKAFHLIEALAEKLAHEVLVRFPLVRGIEIEVEKPGAPVVGVLDTVSVWIERWQVES
jgi:7,8-dihydroneopterin aldolase/epimerase/oxygenase